MGRVVAVAQWLMGKPFRFNSSMRVDLPTPEGPDRTKTRPLAGGASASPTWPMSVPSAQDVRHAVLRRAEPVGGRARDRTPSGRRADPEDRLPRPNQRGARGLLARSGPLRPAAVGSPRAGSGAAAAQNAGARRRAR